MGNDREITSLTTTRNFFLRKNMAELHEGRELYDLNREFHETRGNRKIWVALIVLAIVAVLGLSAFLATRIVARNNKSYELDLDTFKDVDLSDILDEVKKLERELDNAQKELSTLITERNLKLRDIEDWAEQEIRLLSTKGYSAVMVRKMTADIEKEKQARIDQVNDEYDPLIEEKRQALSIIEERKNRYDSRQVEQARRQEEQMNNQKRLFDLERDALKETHEAEILQIRDDYDRKIAELKQYIDKFDTNLKDLYDPVYSSEEIKAILAAEIDNERRREYLPLFNPIYYPDEYLSEERLGDLDTQLREIRTLINQIYTIPFENSTADALIQMDHRVLVLIDSLKAVMDDMSEDQVRRLSVLQKERDDLHEMHTSYSYAMERIARDTGGQGFIVDPRDKNAMLLYIDPVLEVRNGTRALVFRLDEQMIAQVEIYKQNGFIRARVVEQDPDFTLQPFDTLILKMGGGN